MSSWRLPLLLSACLAAPLLAADASVLVGDGTQARGPATSDGRSITVGAAAIPLDRLVAARFNATVAGNVDQGVVLVDGDVIAGVVVGVQSEKVELASDRFGTRTLPLANVAGLILAPQQLTALAHIGDEPAGGRLLNGDRLAGSVTFLNPAAAGINNGKRIIELPRERLSLIRTGTAAGAKDGSTTAVQRVRLITGERISGTLVKLDATTLTLKHAVLGELAVPVALVASVWSEGGAVTSLTTLSAKVTQAGFLGPATLPRADGPANDGPVAVVGGMAERALRIQAECALTYTLDGASDVLVGEVALDPRAVGRGNAAIEVLGDNKSLVRIELGDGAVHPLNVPLTGVRSLVLKTTSGPDQSTTGDLVTWSWPVLVRGVPTAAR
ncbi:MAG TPA: NPCBM/NEW2 domain-containing protein [Planctomycetota bacterium]|nr:NPCBM/NEW2 domain-containing protein [Planctomycetota bacterium]